MSAIPWSESKICKRCRISSREKQEEYWERALFFSFLWWNWAVVIGGCYLFVTTWIAAVGNFQPSNCIPVFVRQQIRATAFPYSIIICKLVCILSLDSHTPHSCLSALLLPICMILIIVVPRKFESWLIRIQTQGGYTALHLAAQNGHVEVVRMLIMAGCDIEAKNVCGHKSKMGRGSWGGTMRWTG